jgi:hypothetical protein
MGYVPDTKKIIVKNSRAVLFSLIAHCFILSINLTSFLSKRWSKLQISRLHPGGETFGDRVCAICIRHGQLRACCMSLYTLNLYIFITFQCALGMHNMSNQLVAVISLK